MKEKTEKYHLQNIIYTVRKKKRKIKNKVIVRDIWQKIKSNLTDWYIHADKKPFKRMFTKALLKLTPSRKTKKCPLTVE